VQVRAVVVGFGAAVLAAMLAGACGGSGSTKNAATTGDRQLRVVAAFYPLQEVADRVGGDQAAVTNVTPAGTEPHDVELSTTKVDAIGDADVVLYLGKGFQPAVERTAKNNPGAVDLLRGLALPAGAPQGDPHVWLDPVLFHELVGHVATAFATANPARRETFEANASKYEAELDALDAEVRAGLATCESRVIVTSHEAFGHLARRYGLVQEAISGFSPEIEPNPKRLAELADLVKSKGVTTVFTETLVSPRVADALAREAGAKTAVLDPIEGLSKKQIAAGETYATVMRSNLAVLRTALRCA
jgi:zinc transport system substrate-binding protein